MGLQSIEENPGVYLVGRCGGRLAQLEVGADVSHDLCADSEHSLSVRAAACVDQRAEHLLAVGRELRQNKRVQVQSRIGG